MIAYTTHTCPEYGGVYAPVIVCDTCGQVITQTGTAYWVVLPDGAVLPQIWHTHKHPCASLDDDLASQYGALVMTEELDIWLEQLAHNFARQTTP